MFMGLGMPIPDLSNKPGPGRPGYGPSGSYDFQFEVAAGQVGITVLPRVNGLRFTIKWQDGTEQAITSAQTDLQSPTTQAGIISINNEELDNTWCDDFKVASGKQFVTKVISWGQNPWNRLAAAFDGCANLTEISTTSLITDTTGNLNATFRDCTGLTEAICKNWDLSAGALIADIFEGCTNLTKLDFTNLKIKVYSSTARAFRYVGSTTADGCEFLFSGLDLSTWSYTGSQNMLWFADTKIKPTSTFANWSFNPSIGPNSMVQLFTTSTITGTNSTLDISGWSSYNGNSMSQWFQNFNNTGAVGNTGAKINLTNLNTTNVNSMYFFGWQCGITEFIGLSTLGANTGNTGTIQMERAFSSMIFLKLSGSSNFGNAFTSSIKPITLKTTFNQLGLGLTSDFSEAPILSNLDASQCVTFQNMFQSCKLSTMPNLDTVTFPTTATPFNGTFSSITTTSYSGSHLDLSNVTMKPSTLSSAFSTLKIQKLTLGNNVDLSDCTIFSSAFINGGTNAQPLEVILPTNADYSSATSFNTAFQGLDGPSTGNPPLTTCVADTLIRRLFATNLNGALTLNLETTKITGAPSVVQSQLDQLRTAGWSITDNSTDAVMPFVYTTPIDTDTTATPTGSFTGGAFSSSNSNIAVNATTGVINTPNAGNTTIRYTITATGCYNEQALVVEAPLAQVNNVYSMAFDGVDDYIDLNSLDQSILNSSFTVSFWLNKTAKGGGLDNDRMIDFTVNASTSLQIITDAATSKFGVNFRQNGSAWIFNKVFNNWNTVTGSWHHIALTWDGTSYEYYFDGSSVATTGTSPIAIGGTGFYLGKRADGVASTEFKGGLDEVAIFNTALTEEEILSIYNATETGKTADLNDLTTPPVKWYRMGD